MLNINPKHLTYRYGRLRINLLKRYPHFFILFFICIAAIIPHLIPTRVDHVAIYVPKLVLKEKDIFVESMAKEAKLNYEEAYKINSAVLACSKKYSIPHSVVLGLIDKESGFNTHAMSNSGAIGLTQVLIKWHFDKYKRLSKELGIKDVYDVDLNVQLGCSVLKEYMISTRHLTSALVRYIGNSDPQYNIAYAADVIRRSHKWKELIEKSAEKEVSYMNQREQIALIKPI